jgi:hypothetical protein
MSSGPVIRNSRRARIAVKPRQADPVAVRDVYLTKKPLTATAVMSGPISFCF